MLASPWRITADRIISFKDPEDIVAEGNVILERQAGPGVKPLKIKADRIRYGRQDASLEAKGNLVLRSEDQEITAQEASINLRNQTGTLQRTTFFFEEDNLYFSGREVEKTGELTYHFQDGWITACQVRPGEKYPWSFKSHDVELTVDNYAFLKHTTFQIKGFPVLYTPYLIFPVKTKRESGFLFPEISHSERDGFGLVAPFFVTLSPSHDMTFFPGFLEKRGEFFGLEFRYVTDFESKGSFAANYLHDKTSDSAEDDFRGDGYFRDQHDRYWVRGKVDQLIYEHLTMKFDIDLVSDRDYLQEYREGITGFTKSNEEFVETFNRGFQEESLTFRESTLQFNSAWESTVLSGEVRGVDSTLDDSSQTTALHTLPRLLWNSHGKLWRMPLNFDWKTEYVNYWREEGVGYHRVDVLPRLTAQSPLGSLFEGRVSAAARETLYRIDSYGDTATGSLPDAEDKNRTAFDFKANTALVLGRDYHFALGGLESLNHTVRPNIEYNYLESDEQSDLPNLDQDDRIQEANLLTYEMNNYFKAKGSSAEGGGYDRYLGYFKVRQSYNIMEVRRELRNAADERRPFSDVNFDLMLYPMQNLYARYQTRLNVYGEGVPQYDFESRYSSKSGNSFSLDYNYLRGSRHDLKLAFKYTMFDRVAITAETTRSLLTDHTVHESLGLQYTPACWGVEILASQDFNDTKIMLIFSLSGLGKAFEVGKGNL